MDELPQFKTIIFICYFFSPISPLTDQCYFLKILIIPYYYLNSGQVTLLPMILPLASYL